MVKNRDRKKRNLVPSRHRRAQSTLEYLILISGVLAVLIIFLKPSGGVFTDAFNKTLGDLTNGMTKVANKLVNSYGP